MTTPKKYAIYSEKMAKLAGSSAYTKPNGTVVEVTGIDDNPTCNFYTWDDKILLGEVCEWKASMQKGSKIYFK